MSEVDNKKLLEGAEINHSNSENNSRSNAAAAGADAEIAAAKKKKIIKYSLIGGSIALVVILAIVLIVVLSNKSGGGDNPEPGPIPDFPVYNPYELQGTLNDEDHVSGFIVTDKPYNGKLHSIALQSLQMVGADIKNHDLTINPKGIPEGENNKFVQNISYYFGVVDYYTGYLKLADANNTRFEVPQLVQRTDQFNPLMRLNMLRFKHFEHPFGLEFRDQLDEDHVLLTTKNSSLVFMDKYIQMDFHVPSQRLFGFGSRQHGFKLGEGVWSMWATENANSNPYDTGVGGLQGASVHPFVMMQTKKNGEFIGLYFKNANAQSPMIKFNDDNTTSKLSYITTGGVLEIYFFMHGSAKTILKSYHNLIGKPSLPPFWAMGWGQGSDSYKNLSDYQTMVDAYQANGFPLNMVYLNLHSLDKMSNFYVNKEDFKDLSKFVASLKDKHIKVIGLLHGGLGAEDPENPIYKMAQESGALIKSTIHKDTNNGALTSSLYGYKQVFLDWLHTEAATILQEGLKEYHGQVEFDGLVLDKNTPYSDCNGECPGGKKSILESRFLPEDSMTLGSSPYTDWYQSYSNQNDDSTYFLPFISGFKNGGNLDTNTLSLNGTHSQSAGTEYDLHNLYGHMMAEHTYSALISHQNFKDHKPFILSKSTFPSTGKYASHFIQSERSFQDLKLSISNLMNFNMFGIPHTGTDVCGYYGSDFDGEICARWIQLATFYPVARINYQVTPPEGKVGNEPYKLTDKWQTIAKDSMHDRYQYLRFIYTCLFEARTEGGSCYDPLFYEHAHDPNVYKDIDATFLVGGAVKISPVLEKNASDTFESYFPSGRWVNLKDYTEVIDGQGFFKLKNRNTVNAHLRPGALIPFQDNTDQTIKGTHELLNRPITIVANRDPSRNAVGQLFLDQGTVAEEIKNEEYEHYEISVQSNTMQKLFRGGKHGSQNHAFDKLVIVDAPDLFDIDFACMWDNHFNIQKLKTTYDEQKKTLTIAVDGETVKFSRFRQISFGSSAKKEVNVCDPLSFQYQLKAGQQFDLNRKSASFIISHQLKTLPDLQVNLTVTGDNTVNVKWNFADRVAEGSPFEIPDEIISTTLPDSTNKLANLVNIKTTPYFQIEILSSDKGVVHTIDSILFDHLLNMYGSTLHTTATDDFHGIFGLGTRAQDDLFYKDGVYSMWSADNGLPYEDGRPPGKQTYGVHPFYMYKNAKNVWVGVFTKLAAAQDWYVKNYPDTGIVETTMIAAGGVVDLFFIVDTTPQIVAKSYWNIVGKPIMPPFWSLGWHQSRWGYKDTKDLQAVIDGYAAAKIPLDTIWSDIDYMKEYKDFTVDDSRFGDIQTFIKNSVHAKGMKYVPIIDAGISIRDDYDAFTTGVDRNVFLKVRDDVLVGAVWPKEAAFPDWWAENTSNWWQTNLKDFKQKQLDFDGLWLDMNEAANFCHGVCVPDQQMYSPLKRQLRYTPTGKDLEYKALPLNARHANGYYELDTHSLFGTMEVKATHEWYKQKDIRHFILSRSSFAGMGKFGFNWLGDNYSDPWHMGQSVLGAMMMNVFGIPFVGSDICGFGGTTNAELCARWHFVGAFQPFTRNHNVYGSASQEPYAFAGEHYDDDHLYTDIMKRAIQVRYHLINYYYTQFYLANQGNGPIFKPVFFEYPDEIMAFKDQTNNFMIGDALKVSVLANNAGVNETNFYIPPGVWCNIFNGKEKCFPSTGQMKTYSTKAYDFYVHLREGKIVPMVDATRHNVMNTIELSQKTIDLHVLGKLLPGDEKVWQAEGVHFNDDSNDAQPVDGNYNLYKFVASASTAKINIVITHVKEAQHDPPVFNDNDCLGQLHIYNALAQSAAEFNKASVVFNNGTAVNMGTTAYQQDIDRVVFQTNKRKLCFHEISLITLFKQ